MANIPTRGKKNTPLKESSNNTTQIPMLDVKKMGDITWRIFRIMSEFIEGFQFLSRFKREVTIFGSARFTPDNPWYGEAEKLGRLLSKANYRVITGGGPGIMEAANKGAFAVNHNHSIGINIQLPTEQRINDFVGHAIGFHYFFTRKVMLAASSQVYIFFPGGFGTLDEFAEMVELVQTGKMQPTPVILVGKDFWQPMLDWMNDTMLKKYHTISAKDLKLITLVDTAEEVMPIVKKTKERTIF